jgi:hypothetical protein
MARSILAVKDDGHQVRKMPDKKITVRRGERVSIEIPEERPVAPASEAQRRAVFPSVTDEELYVFRQGITFYDLGTRKTEDGSYAHVSFAEFNAANGTERLIGLTNSYNAALLAGDPTQSDCLKLPKESEYLYLDAVFKKTDEEDKRELIGQKDKRPYMGDFPQAGQAMPEAVHKSKWSGALKVSRAGWQLKVESAWHYNPFDTSRLAHLKITNEPDASSESVEFKVSNSMRVYLTPRCNFFGSGTHYIISRFLPVLPGFEPEKVPYLSGIGYLPAFSNQMAATATPAFWSAVDAYYSSVYPPAYWAGASYVTDDASAAQLGGVGRFVLLAVIVKGSRKYYVWMADQIDTSGWRESRVINPNL